MADLRNDEWDALDAYHLDQEIECARKGEYLDAEDHKKRRAELSELRQATKEPSNG